MGGPRTMSGWLTRTGLLGTDAEGRLVDVRAVLRVTRGPDAGATIELDAGTASVGTHPRGDLVLSDPTVSRRHAELLLLRGGVRVRDLGSKNGTFVGGTRVDDATVPLPFELRVGSTHVEVRAAEVPLPEVLGERASFGPLVGQSAAMRRVFGVLERVAATDVPILFSGEAGTGKTAACAAVHQASGRAGALLFLDPTRAIDREGVDAALSASHGGTLILERVDEWPRRATDAMVAALDAREHGMDARILATAAGDPREAVEAGRLSRALWFFIGSVHLVLPPLGDRLEDVPLLLASFLRELGHEGSAPPPELARAVGAGLRGNVRELHALTSAALARRAPLVSPPAPSEPATAGLSYHEAKAQLLDAFERRYLEDLMSRHAGVVVHAADEAGLGRNHLARLLKKHGLK